MDPDIVLITQLSCGMSPHVYVMRNRKISDDPSEVVSSLEWSWNGKSVLVITVSTQYV